MYVRPIYIPIRLFANNVAHSNLQNCFHFDDNIDPDGNIIEGAYQPMEPPYQWADGEYPTSEPVCDHRRVDSQRSTSPSPEVWPTSAEAMEFGREPLTYDRRERWSLTTPLV